MKKKFVSKNSKKKFKIKFLLFLFIVIISIIITFRLLLNSSLKINDKDFVRMLLSDSYTYSSNNYIDNIYKKIKKNYTPDKLLSTNYYKLVKKENKTLKKIKKVINKDSSYQIYIYNTHQTEEYASNTFLEGEVHPTVMMTSYILEDVFNKNNYHTLVEERSIPDLLKSNGWRYYRSYDASRIYMEDIKKNNPSIKYFIDVHRDSLSKNKTTIDINGKSYARVIFLIGTDNPKYQENLEFVSKINDRLNSKYPNLSKGIYQKGGSGVNGIYNQDNSKTTFLIEIGGIDNTPLEVLNSTLAFADCFMEVININEG